MIATGKGGAERVVFGLLATLAEKEWSVLADP